MNEIKMRPDGRWAELSDEELANWCESLGRLHEREMMTEVAKRLREIGPAIAAAVEAIKEVLPIDDDVVLIADIRGSALEFAKFMGLDPDKEFISMNCENGKCGVCMGFYGGKHCQHFCHQEGSDARDVGMPR